MSPAESGAILTPRSIAMTATSTIVSIYLLRLGYRWPMLAGMACIVGTMLLLSVLLILVPYIPGLRDLPRWIPIHRLIWRRYYASKRARPPTTGASTPVPSAAPSAGSAGGPIR